jgi:hypothetical protein
MHSNYFQEVKISLLKSIWTGHVKRYQVLQEQMKKMLLLCPRRKKFSFKPFGLVMSRHQVVQEEMKKNAFFYYFQEIKVSLLKHLVRSGQDIRWFKKK